MHPSLLFSQTEGFSQAARAVISYLHGRLGFNLWMVTRTEQDDWIVLESEDHGYNVTPGKVFSWADSFCSRMVTGEGPRIAPRSKDVPEYAAALIGRQVEIGAYIGVPLTRDDGSLFGTLCAIDPAAKPDAIEAELPLVELLASLLSTVLTWERKAMEKSRQSELLGRIANSDLLTSLLNRRGWEEVLRIEEERCRHYGDPACVLSIDLDGLKATNDQFGHAAGDELIVRAGRALRSAIREPDAVARLGGDEFAILALGCSRSAGEHMLERVRKALSENGVQASCGLAARVPSQGLAQACKDADMAMYREKAFRKPG